MKGYISKVLFKYGHPISKKTRLSLHKHSEVIYDAKEQLYPEDDTTTLLDSQGTKRVQGIVGALLYYAQDVDNKILAGLSAIWSQQASATHCTNEAIDQILDYCATNPSDGIIYRYSNMVLCAHSDAGFHNERKGCSLSGEHIFLSENDATLWWNRPVLTLAKNIKFVMSSASETELGEMFITAQEIVATRQTLQEMKRPQPKSPL